jgi:transposase/predicted RNA-binding Zn-ribbon protein involved in translation (DUF1610 family)
MVVLAVKQRFWLVKKCLKGCDVEWICGKLGVHRDTVYYWMSRFHEEGWGGLKLKSHRPHLIHRTSQDTVDLIVHLREENGWGPVRTEHKLTNLPQTPVDILEQARKTAMDAGLNYVYIGNVPGHNAENTTCPKCGKTVVERQGYTIKQKNLISGACKNCGQKISGIWQ